jgi:subtilisin family serine protease
LLLLGVPLWHEAGFRGQGTKIAVLDSGFRGYRAHLGRELPWRVLTRSFRSDGNLEAKDSQHGILCAEILHTVAPDAELLFANWEPDSPEQFLAAARWARQQGARIITCSVIMPSWSDGEGGGAFHEALTPILGTGEHAHDLLCFASAGNTAQRHWSGRYQAGTDGYHEWKPGQTMNTLTPWSAGCVSVELCGRPGARYQLCVLNTVTGAPVGCALARCGAQGCCSVVRFVPEPRQTYQVRVRPLSGPAGSFHLVVLGGDLRYATAPGSIPCPADGPEVVAVGAVAPSGRRAWYSSCGPNSRRPKPDFVAPVPFPSLWRTQPFTGTSAAAPQAAALAALWWSRHPEWTAQQVRDALQASALDLGPPGHDYETGYGLVRLPAAELQHASHLSLEAHAH